MPIPDSPQQRAKKDPRMMRRVDAAMESVTFQADGLDEAEYRVFLVLLIDRLEAL